MISYVILIGAFLWAGMILGISFLESWVKFKTPTLDKAVGLDVGRTVFRYFQRVQMGCLIVVVLLEILHKPALLSNLLLGILLSILVLQIHWIFPILCQRVDNLAKGIKSPHSYAHAAYGAGELIKFFTLLALGINEIHRL